MCFRHLPIEFDAVGNARLKQGLTDPWGVQRNHERADRRRRELAGSAGLSRGQRAVTHVGGSHAFQFVVNHDRARRRMRAPMAVDRLDRPERGRPYSDGSEPPEEP